MRAIIQRVKHSSVKIGKKTAGEIGNGLNILLGIGKQDTQEEAEYIAEKISKMRIFNDLNGKMNLSVQDIEGELLVVSQFTLYADCRKGNRPGFTESAEPEKANKLYEYFISYIGDLCNTDVKTGEFGADMTVDIKNDGPVTILLDSDIRKRPR